MSSDEFWGYWKDVHSPIGSRIPGLEQYVLYRGIEDDNGAPPYDGIALMSFSDTTALERGWASPEGVATMDDVPNFVDVSKLVAITCQGHQVI